MIHLESGSLRDAVISATSSFQDFLKIFSSLVHISSFKHYSGFQVDQTLEGRNFTKGLC